MSLEIIERTAPSPTGNLHLGHVYSALTAYQYSRNKNGKFKLRLEDIDHTRCSSKYEEQIVEDLAWLGIDWDGPIMKQSKRFKNYLAALDQLKTAGIIYPCSCTRSDIKNAITAPHNQNDSPPIYPGTCLNIVPTRGVRALRLNLKKALHQIESKSLFFYECGFSVGNYQHKQEINEYDLIKKFGDVVLARKDIGTSYNLSVVIDDSAQNVSHVTRGIDLFEITPIQVLLQKLLGLRTPVYRHHKLLYDHSGKKLSKRNSPDTIIAMRNNGASAKDIIKLAFSHNSQ